MRWPAPNRRGVDSQPVVTTAQVLSLDRHRTLGRTVNRTIDHQGCAHPNLARTAPRIIINLIFLTRTTAPEKLEKRPQSTTAAS